METTNEDWKNKLHNLHTRDKGISSEHQIKYKELLRHVSIGKTVLDIGCGTRWLKNYLPAGTEYSGLDAYVEAEDIHTIAIEDLDVNSKLKGYFETIFIFAAIDGMRDLKKAFENIKKLEPKNVVILTGINIAPDQYHTHLLTEKMILDLMSPYKRFKFKEVLKDKIIFLEFVRR